MIQLNEMIFSINLENKSIYDNQRNKIYCLKNLVFLRNSLKDLTRIRSAIRPLLSQN